MPVFFQWAIRKKKMHSQCLLFFGILEKKKFIVIAYFFLAFSIWEKVFYMGNEPVTVPPKLGRSPDIGREELKSTLNDEAGVPLYLTYATDIF